MSAARPPTHVHAGDLARALFLLGGDATQRAQIARSLGFTLRPEEPPGRAPAPPALPPSDSPPSPATPPRPPPPPPPPATPQHTPAQETPRAVFTRLADEPPRSTNAPSGSWRPLDPDPTPAAPPHEPLLMPAWTRALLAALTRTRDADGAIDVDACVARACRGDVWREVPRVSRWAQRGGVHLLVDESPSLMGLARDVDAVALALRRVAGAERVALRYFHGDPELAHPDDAEEGPYAPPAGTAVLVLTDFGRSARTGPAPGAERWLAFARRLARSRCPLLVLTPTPLDRAPIGLARMATLVPWDRRARPSHARRSGGSPGVTDAPTDWQTEARALASALSIAVRVEPHLLRAMRLREFPQLPASAELDLWNGPLVSARQPGGFALAPRHTAALREELGARQDLLRRAWAVVRAQHATLPHALQAEEELTVLGLAAPGHPAWADDATLPRRDERVQELLWRLAATITAEGSRGADVAAWAGRALPQLPGEIRSRRDARALAAIGALRRGYGTGDQAIEPAEIPAVWLEHALQREDAAVNVDVGEASLRLSLGEVGPHTLAMVKTSPMWALLRTDAGERWIRWKPPEMTVRHDGSLREIGDLRGRRWTLRGPGVEHVIARALEPEGLPRTWVVMAPNLLATCIAAGHPGIGTQVRFDVGGHSTDGRVCLFDEATGVLLARCDRHLGDGARTLAYAPPNAPRTLLWSADGLPVVFAVGRALEPPDAASEAVYVEVEQGSGDVPGGAVIFVDGALEGIARGTRLTTELAARGEVVGVAAQVIRHFVDKAQSVLRVPGDEASVLVETRSARAQAVHLGDGWFVGAGPVVGAAGETVAVRGARGAFQGALRAVWSGRDGCWWAQIDTQGREVGAVRDRGFPARQEAVPLLVWSERAGFEPRAYSVIKGGLRDGLLPDEFTLARGFDPEASDETLGALAVSEAGVVGVAISQGDPVRVRSIRWWRERLAEHLGAASGNTVSCALRFVGGASSRIAAGELDVLLAQYQLPPDTRVLEVVSMDDGCILAVSGRRTIADDVRRVAGTLREGHFARLSWIASLELDEARPLKGAFGWLPERDGFRASYERRGREVVIRVDRTAPAPDEWRHVTLHRQTPDGPARLDMWKEGGAATVTIAYAGPETLGFECDDGTRLELDLTDAQDDAPTEANESEPELTCALFRALWKALLSGFPTLADLEWSVVRPLGIDRARFVWGALQDTVYDLIREVWNQVQLRALIRVMLAERPDNPVVIEAARVAMSGAHQPVVDADDGDWSLPHELRRELRVALLDAFPSHGELRRLVSFHLDVSFCVRVNMAGTLEDAAQGIIEEAQRRGVVRALLRAARSENPRNPTLAVLARKALPDDHESAPPDESSEGARGRTGAVLRSVFDALLQAFPSTADLELLARLHLDLNLAEVTSGSSSDQAYDLIRWAAARGREGALIQAMVEECPENDAVRALARLAAMGAPPPAADAEGADVRWQREQLKELRRALMDAFPSVRELDRLSYFYLDLPLDTIVARSSLEHTAFELIEWAQHQGRLRALLLGACAENPHNERLASIVEALLGDTVAPRG